MSLRKEEKVNIPRPVIKVDDQGLVQKANPLLTIGIAYDLPLGACKLLDFYLSQIDMHDEGTREVSIQKGKLQRILGLKNLDRKYLEYHLYKLTSLSLEFLLDDAQRKEVGKMNLNLFEYSFIEKDTNYIRLSCTPAAMKYVFNVENMGYLKYRFYSIKNLTSIYSYNLFTYIGKNRFRKTWVEDVETLKAELNVNPNKYKGFHEFKQRILDSAQKELEEKTLCRFDYQTIKDGREVVAIQFSMISAGDFEVSSETMRTIAALDTKANMSSQDWLSAMEENIEANTLRTPGTEKIVNAILSVMVEIMVNRSANIKVGDLTLPTALVQERMLGIKKEQAEHAIKNIQRNRGNITNAKAYIRTILYNATENVSVTQHELSPWVKEAIAQHKEREEGQK